MKIRGFALQSYNEFFAVGILSSLINLSYMTGSSDLLFYFFSFLFAFLFLVASLIYVGYIGYKINDAYRSTNGDEEILKERFPLLLKDIDITSKWSVQFPVIFLVRRFFLVVAIVALIKFALVQLILITLINYSYFVYLYKVRPLPT